MTPEFASLVNPVIHYVLDLTTRIKAGERTPLLSEQDQIHKRLREFEEQAHRITGLVSTKDFELARKGLVYWIDEVLTAADPTLERNHA